MPNGTAFSANTPNFSGLMFLRGNAENPLLSVLAGRSRLTKSHRFAVGQSYTLPEASNPDVSPAASMTAPTPSYVTREQDYNVTQIFHESVSVSYEKESNMGELSGINIAGQQANPTSELDFQIDAKSKIIRNNMEYAFMRGEYQESTSENVANKTRGLAQAIRTNVIDVGGKEASMWDFADAQVAIRENGGVTTGLTIWADTVVKFQLCAEAKAINVTPQDALDPVSGINVTTLVTPAGTLRIIEGRYLPVGTAFILNLGQLRPVEQITPGKGNFFYEELGRVGAGIQGQIFGQAGLDYGPEFYHAKLINIKATYTRPQGMRIVVEAGKPIPMYETAAITSASITNATIRRDTDTLNVALGIAGTISGTKNVTAKIEVADTADGAYSTLRTGTYALTAGQTNLALGTLADLTGDKYVRVTVSSDELGSATTNAVYAYAPVLTSASVLNVTSDAAVNIALYDQQGMALADVSDATFAVEVDGNDVLNWTGALTSSSNMPSGYTGETAKVRVTKGAVTIYSNEVTVA